PGAPLARRTVYEHAPPLTQLAGDVLHDRQERLALLALRRGEVLNRVLAPLPSQRVGGDGKRVLRGLPLDFVERREADDQIHLLALDHRAIFLERLAVANVAWHLVNKQPARHIIGQPDFTKHACVITLLLVGPCSDYSVPRRDMAHQAGLDLD